MLYRRQFLIARAPHLPDATWTSFPLTGGLVLSHSDALPVSRWPADGPAEAVLLGDAVTPDGPVRLDGPVPPDMTEAAGRWCLIAEGRVRLDCWGGLGVFHMDGLAGSSAGQIAGIAGDRLGPPRGGLGWGGLDWYPPPGSRYPGLSKLCLGEALDLATFAPVPEDRDYRRPALPYPDTLDRIERLLVGTIARAAETASTVYVPLTSGYDSRFVLAAALRAGVRPVTFTQVHDRLDRADADLPPRLARAAGVEHRWVPSGPVDPDRLALYDRHTGGHEGGADRMFFARGQLDWIEDDALVLRGGGFGVGKATGRGLPDWVPDHAAAIFPDGDPDLRRGIDDWLARRRDVPGLDWRDQLMIDQRGGGWLSAVEQALDLTPGRYFTVANSLAYYTTTMTMPEATRQAKRHHLDLIARWAPELLRLPFAEAVDPVSVLRRRLRPLRRAWRAVRPAPGGGRSRPARPTGGRSPGAA